MIIMIIMISCMPSMMMMPVHPEFTSSYWEPAIISECLSSFPKSAPCIKKDAGGNKSNIAVAQELIFPPFKLRMPSFISEGDSEAWKTDMRKAMHGGRMVVDEEKDYGRYWIVIGQNLVFKDAMYTGQPPPDGWNAQACGIQSSHVSFLAPADSNIPAIHDTLIVATSPDSWSWQHFLDRLVIIVAQASLTKVGDPNNLTVVSGAVPRDPYINFVYEALGVKRRMHTPHKHNELKAKNLIFPCRCPLIHPFHYLYVIEKTIGTAAFLRPLSERKFVIYGVRGRGAERNGGRRILNDEKLIEGLKALLAERKQDETLIVFEMKNYPTYEATKELFGHARAVFGPHGGSLMNLRFSPADTLVIEFLPTGSPFFFEQTRLMHQR